MLENTRMQLNFENEAERSRPLHVKVTPDSFYDLTVRSRFTSSGEVTVYIEFPYLCNETLHWHISEDDKYIKRCIRGERIEKKITVPI